MVKYWDRLQPEMKAKGWDITRLAAEMKISFQAVDKVKKGGSFGSTNNLKAAKIFGVNPEWLATGKGPRLAVQSYNFDDVFKPHTAEDTKRAYGAINYEKDHVRAPLEHIAKAISLMEPASRPGLLPLFSALTIGPDSLETIDAIVLHIEGAPAKARESPPKQETPAKNSSRAA